MESIKEKLKTISKAAEAISYLGKLWLKENKLTKEQYLDLLSWWEENRPQMKFNPEYKELTPQVGQIINTFGGKIIKEENILFQNNLSLPDIPPEFKTVDK